MLEKNERAMQVANACIARCFQARANAFISDLAGGATSPRLTKVLLRNATRRRRFLLGPQASPPAFRCYLQPSANAPISDLAGGATSPRLRKVILRNATSRRRFPLGPQASPPAFFHGYHQR